MPSKALRFGSSPTLSDKVTGRDEGNVKTVTSSTEIEPDFPVGSRANPSLESFRRLWSQAYSLATDALSRRDHKEFLKLIDAATTNAEEYLHSGGDRSLLLVTLVLHGDEQMALENPGEALTYYQAALAHCTEDLPECTFWYDSLKVRITKCRKAISLSESVRVVQACHWEIF